jgi:hypothetical protein
VLVLLTIFGLFYKLIGCLLLFVFVKPFPT